MRARERPDRGVRERDAGVGQRGQDHRAPERHAAGSGEQHGGLGEHRHGPGHHQRCAPEPLADALGGAELVLAEERRRPARPTERPIAQLMRHPSIMPAHETNAPPAKPKRAPDAVETRLEGTGRSTSAASSPATTTASTTVGGRPSTTVDHAVIERSKKANGSRIKARTTTKTEAHRSAGTCSWREPSGLRCLHGDGSGAPRGGLRRPRGRRAAARLRRLAAGAGRPSWSVHRRAVRAAWLRRGRAARARGRVARRGSAELLDPEWRRTRTRFQRGFLSHACLRRDLSAPRHRALAQHPAWSTLVAVDGDVRTMPRPGLTALRRVGGLDPEGFCHLRAALRARHRAGARRARVDARARARRGARRGAGVPEAPVDRSAVRAGPLRVVPRVAGRFHLCARGGGVATEGARRRAPLTSWLEAMLAHENLEDVHFSGPSLHRRGRSGCCASRLTSARSGTTRSAWSRTRWRGPSRSSPSPTRRAGNARQRCSRSGIRRSTTDPWSRAPPPSRCGATTVARLLSPCMRWLPFVLLLGCSSSDPHPRRANRHRRERRRRRHGQRGGHRHRPQV